MAAIKLGLAGLTFGFASDETGGVIQSLEIRRSRDKAVVRDADGDTVACAYFDPKEEISFEFFTTGGTGLSAASPGVAVSVTNYTPAAGLIITEEVTISRTNTDYQKHSVKAMNYALVTS
jgi:hypothetical protein